MRGPGFTRIPWVREARIATMIRPGFENQPDPPMARDAGDHLAIIRWGRGGAADGS